MLHGKNIIPKVKPMFATIHQLFSITEALSIVKELIVKLLTKDFTMRPTADATLLEPVSTFF